MCVCVCVCGNLERKKNTTTKRNPHFEMNIVIWKICKEKKKNKKKRKTFYNFKLIN